MKHIALILSLLIFCLSIVPCSDGGTCDEKSGNELSENHDHSQDKDDHCTPFCVCACCGVSFIPATLMAETPKDLAIPTYTFHYKMDYSRDHSANIWHPPTA